MQKTQYDQYDGDNDQNMDPTSGFREAWTDPPTEKTEQPQDYENYYDNPQQRHEKSPIERTMKGIVEATQSGDQMAGNLSTEKDENTCSNSQDRKDNAQATQRWDQCKQAIGNEKNGQQEHAYILGDFHGVTPFQFE